VRKLLCVCMAVAAAVCMDMVAAMTVSRDVPVATRCVCIWLRLGCVCGRGCIYGCIYAVTFFSKDVTEK
jgi:hypothetical protein